MLQVPFSRQSLILLVCILFLFSCVGVVTGYEEKTGWAWYKKYASDQPLSASDVQQTQDGGFILAGHYSHSVGSAPLKGDAPGGSIWGALIIKTDAQGNPEWSRQIDYRTIYYFGSVRPSADGGYLFATFKTSLAYSIIKTDQKGNFLWDVPLKEEVSNVLATPDGGCIYTEGRELFIEAFNVGKLDTNGVAQWSRTYRKPYTFHLRSVVLSSDGGFLVGLSASDKIEIIKFDAAGQEQWNRVYDFLDLFTFRETTGGGYSVAYKKYDAKTYEFFIGVAHLDSKGNLEWAHDSMGNAGNFNPNADTVQPTLDGGFLFLRGDGLLKINRDGNIDWAWAFHENAEVEQSLRGKKVWRYLVAVQQIADGGYILAGEYDVLSPDKSKCDAFFCEYIVENADAWLMKIDKASNPSPRTETSDRVFLASGTPMGIPGFGMFLSFLGGVIALIHWKRTNM